MPATKPKALGRLALPRDERDYRLETILQRTTATRKYWYRPLVLDQGDTGTCEGNAWTAWLADGPITHPDITALDNEATGEAYARQLYLDATGDTSLDQGAYTRQVVRILVERGLVGSYYRASSVEEVVQAILTIGPVCFGSPWYRSMDYVISEFDNVYLKVDESSGIRGGHEYVLDGVNLAPAEGPPYVRLHNSWSSEWAHMGTARVSIDDLHALYVGDAFIASEVP